MNQVLLHLPFWNSEHASQVIGGHPSIRQEINEALTQGPFEWAHVRMVRTGVRKIQTVLSSFPRIILSLAHLKVAPTPPFWHNPSLHQLPHHDQSTGRVSRLSSE